MYSFLEQLSFGFKESHACVLFFFYLNLLMHLCISYSLKFIS